MSENLQRIAAILSALAIVLSVVCLKLPQRTSTNNDLHIAVLPAPNTSHPFEVETNELPKWQADLLTDPGWNAESSEVPQIHEDEISQVPKWELEMMQKGDGCFLPPAK